MDIALLKQINAARSERRALAVVTDVKSGSKQAVHSNAVNDHTLGSDIAARLMSGKSGMVADENGAETFIQVYVPPPRIVVIGAVHISQALAPMAQACDFDVTVIDPRTAFATPERFAGVDLHGEWPEAVLETRPLDAFTAMVAVTHDPKIDDFPLQAALNANCFYIGALGSRKTHAKRIDRLRHVGVSAAALDRIHAPIGLNIGAASPAEIAVAVLAEIIQRLRQGETA